MFFRPQRVLTFVAKPFTGNKYDKMYFFDPMNIKKPGEYTWVSKPVVNQQRS